MFLEQILNGLAQGSIYALIGIGFALIFGVLGLVHFAHGEVYMIGAFIGFIMITAFHLPVWAALLLAIAGAAIVGFLVELLNFRPLRKAPEYASMICTLGLSVVLQNATMLIWGSDTKSLPLSSENVAFSFFGAKLSMEQILIFTVSLGLMVGLQYILYRSKLGKAIRAIAQNREAAALMGVNINQVIAATFAIGSGLGGAAGVLVGLYYNAFYPTMGFMAGLKAFTATVLGGLTSVPGAVLGGIILGVVENITAAYISSGFRDLVAFVILILVLFIRPSGIFGRGIQEKV
ncbi:branched-chain amino acid ABC transporter permease [Heliobacterium chlorum]|uniref:Branched-chain amino acid ABC transporter permease n=1 Tax=Heliobacterium chlorum TaxID=2698 RepID=A0ABR7T6E6_HELCL|nr:branched-chain amino acid ABC transporter permease [Heliobacterium chlorum]MBC9786344.1 branched-chain amino acid ABC transporter permease [Heliobacterium chlorum]